VFPCLFDQNTNDEDGEGN